MKDNYNSVEDFISDESFVSWVYRTHEKNNIVNEANSILNLIRLKNISVEDEQLEISEARLRNSMDADYNSAKIINIKRRRVWYAVAAVLIISFTFSLSLIFKSAGKSQFATNYGQVK